MTIRREAISWLKQKLPGGAASDVRSSRYYADGELWFFTLPTEVLMGRRQGSLKLVLEKPDSRGDFFLLVVPYELFARRAADFDVRRDAQFFDMHISAKRSSWLRETRGRGVDFAPYLQGA